MNMRNFLRAALVGGLLLLSGCWINNTSSNGNSTSNSSSGGAQTVSGFAANDINTATCTNQAPRDVNGVTFTPDETQTDVTMLTPACQSAGP